MITWNFRWNFVLQASRISVLFRIFAGDPILPEQIHRKFRELLESFWFLSKLGHTKNDRWVDRIYIRAHVRSQTQPLDLSKIKYNFAAD